MQQHFGDFIKQSRMALSEARGQQYSLRQVAGRAGLEPSYLSKIERGLADPPGEEAITRLALELELDADMLLALAGRVSSELQSIIRKRPLLFASMLRELKDAPDTAILRVVREVRDGNW
ncbi:helix-turn-helix transcriptional regulator [Paraburkholderia sp. UCT31]|uniref:helix-turn-helix domain-containing protein n=1 Tax=Paraburkholderia sp. UCT31 TaxID=2615209 RepID=UPI001655B937|nr:helix-turn-helix transcriptional regulator [Paraburkholderia sp. UCT31]MBC8737421.1 helix-turn-helix transcriptional regulator [Paraburkholderia sp. UCT31]